jgi:hypothetical protein
MGFTIRCAPAFRWLATAAFLVASIGGFADAQIPAPATPPAERLHADIIQRKDKPLRRQRLEEILAILSDTKADPARHLNALVVLARVGDVPFDRAPFLPVVKALLKSPHEDIRRAALKAMPSVGAGEADLPELAKLADDPSERVREYVTSSLYFSAHGKGEAVASPVVEKLLADPSEKVKLATLHSLWGKPISAAAEEKVIALSRETRAGGPNSLGYDSVYYALSTRPIVSVPVARRLIEVMQDTQAGDLRGRAAWGLSNRASPEATDLVVQALVEELDENLDAQIRSYAVQGLSGHRTPAALAKLRQIAEKEESTQLRDDAAKALK